MEVEGEKKERIRELVINADRLDIWPITVMAVVAVILHNNLIGLNVPFVPSAICPATQSRLVEDLV